MTTGGVTETTLLPQKYNQSLDTTTEAVTTSTTEITTTTNPTVRDCKIYIPKNCLNQFLRSVHLVVIHLASVMKEANKQER